MSTVILKNLYRGGNNIKQMFKDGDKIYQMFERFVFEVDANSLTFDYEGNTLTLTITTSDPWTMTKPEWLTASSVSGMGNTTVTLTVPQNPTEDSRDGNIVLTCEGKTITIPVEQKGDVGLDTPLTFEILTDGYINWVKRRTSAPTVTIQYRINEGEWVSVQNTSTSGRQIPVVTGDKVEFRGTNTTYSGNYFNTFSGSTCQYNLYGNIMSMINATDFSGLTTLQGAYTFESFFRHTNVIDASKLVLPATTLTNNCYQGMFMDCTLLTAVSELPAPILTNQCYYGMFSGCTSLNYIKCLATTNVNTTNCNSWLTGVSSTGTFVKKTGVSWSSGVSGIPSGWIIQEVDL